MLFKNRRDAGYRLASLLGSYAGGPTVVLAIPNGGVPVALEIAQALKAELDIVVCRKLSLPLNPEGGLGAVADDGTVILNEEVIRNDGLSREQIEYESEKVKSNVKDRRLKYKGNEPAPRLSGKTAIIVDDGLASGITMTVAVESVKHRLPREILVAVPVASATGYQKVSAVASRIVTCAVARMSRFYLADFYRDWNDISDSETLLALSRWRKEHAL